MECEILNVDVFRWMHLSDLHYLYRSSSLIQQMYDTDLCEIYYVHVEDQKKFSSREEPHHSEYQDIPETMELISSHNLILHRKSFA